MEAVLWILFSIVLILVPLYIYSQLKCSQTLMWHNSLLHNNLDIIFTLDRNKRVITINDTVEKILGYTKEEFISMSFFPLIDQKDRSHLTEILDKSLNAHSQEIELTLKSKLGVSIDFLFTTVPIIKRGKVKGIIGIAKDITEQRVMKQKLYESEQKYKSLFEYNTDAVISFDLQGNFKNLNQACEIISGYSREELLCMNFTQLIGKEEIDKALKYFHLASKGEPQSFKSKSIHKDGHIIHQNVTNLPIYVNGSIVGVYAIVKDITKYVEATNQIKYLAYHDPLTGLPNRRLFQEQLKEGIQNNSQTAVLYMDLDQFKLINDTLGHSIGDSLLRSVAEKLSSCIGLEGILSRLGGDEFAVLLKDTTEEEACCMAENILLQFKNSSHIQQHELYVTPSIGIAMYPTHAQDEETLIRMADAAMYRAKTVGKNNYQLYHDDMDSFASERLSLQTEMHKALKKGEFSLYFQPKIDIQTNQLKGAEALLRWNHSTLGYISPDKFIPIAEETGLIIPIGEWVLRTACRQLMKWNSTNPDLSIAVNLSILQFYQLNLIDLIKQILLETGIKPYHLDFEITESITMDVQAAMSILHQLKELGVNISMDDFGKGYSSLNYLKNFPIDTLKIDHSFIRDIMSSTNDQNIVKTIIGMAGHLNLRVIAEGVETEEQLTFLKENNCNEAQGYYFNPPLAVDDFEKAYINP